MDLCRRLMSCRGIPRNNQRVPKVAIFKAIRLDGIQKARVESCLLYWINILGFIIFVVVALQVRDL